MLGEIGGRRRRGWQDEMAGWHHWLNGREFEWTLGVGDGQGGLACCDSWGHKEQLSDWTELKETRGTSLVVQWLRICLPIQRTRVWSLDKLLLFIYWVLYVAAWGCEAWSYGSHLVTWSPNAKNGGEKAARWLFDLNQLQNFLPHSWTL